MKTTLRHSLGGLALLSALTLHLQPATARAQGTAFTYQGRLDSDGTPAAGVYDLRFTIHDAGAGGNQWGPALTNSAVAVNNGLFTATLDFGFGVFTGAPRWLEIAVRTNGGGAFTTLSPRQALLPTPYAFWAANASQAVTVSGTVPASGLNGLYSNPVNFNNPANSFTGNGAGLSNVNAATLGGWTAAQFWQTGGNAGTSPGTDFLGTTDNQPLELRINNQRVLRLQPGPQAPNVIGGAASNSVSAGLEGATIAGGGLPLFPNRITNNYATIGGGTFNLAGGGWATVGGGRDNAALGEHSTVAGGVRSSATGLFGTVGGGGYNVASGDASTVAGGWTNRAAGFVATVGGGEQNSVDGYYTTVAGGYDNRILSGAYSSTIGGGYENRLGTNTGNATIGGGYTNVIGDDLTGATIAGGAFNVVPNGSHGATIGGGGWNRAGGAATVPGGYFNEALGSFSFAAGYRAKAQHPGAFVWADSTEADFASTVANQFSVRASGGVRLVTGGAGLSVDGGLSVSGPLTLPAGQVVKSVNGRRDDVVFSAGNGLVLAGTVFSLASSGITITDDADRQFGFKAVVPTGSFENKFGLWGVGGEATGWFPLMAVGVLGESRNGVGVWGFSSSSQSVAAGVRGQGIGSATGVRGQSGSGYGVYGVSGGSGSAVYGENTSDSGYAGDFNGHARVTGQLRFGSTTRQMIDLWGGIYGLGVQAGTHYFRTGAGTGDRFAWYQGGTHSETALDPGAGGTFLASLDRSYLNLRGAGNEQPYLGGDGAGGDIEIGSRNAAILNVGFWNSAAGQHMNVFARTFNPTSDREAKQDFEPVEPAAILEKVAVLPITRWAFKGEPGTRHIGPTAQDFRAAFGVGGSDKTIATVDADGVALAAIQGLNRKLEETTRRLEAENAELKQRLAQLERIVHTLSARGNGGGQ